MWERFPTAMKRCDPMRVYAVADIHGKPGKIERIRKVLSESKSDALVVAGDITNYFNADSVVGQLNSMPVPVLAIRQQA